MPPAPGNTIQRAANSYMMPDGPAMEDLQSNADAFTLYLTRTFRQFRGWICAKFLARQLFRMYSIVFNLSFLDVSLSIYIVLWYCSYYGYVLIPYLVRIIQSRQAYERHGVKSRKSKLASSILITVKKILQKDEFDGQPVKIREYMSVWELRGKPTYCIMRRQFPRPARSSRKTSLIILCVYPPL